MNESANFESLFKDSGLVGKAARLELVYEKSLKNPKLRHKSRSLLEKLNKLWDQVAAESRNEL